MKKQKKICGILLSVILLLGLLPISVMAATTTQDGLNVTLSTDKENYEKGDEIDTFISVKNQNSYAMSGIDINVILPDNYILKDGEVISKRIEILSAGETVEFTTKCIASTDVTEPDNGSNPETPAEPDNSSNIETAAEPDNGPNTDTAAIDDVQTSADLVTPDTGDNSAIFTWIIVTITGITFVIVSIKKNNNLKILALVLCGSTILTAMSNDAILVKADNLSTNKSKITLSNSIVVNEKNINIGVTVEYDVHESLDEKTYTRAEWVKILVDECGYPTEEVSNWDYVFSDIKDSQYAKEIQTAYDYCILDTSETEFKPNDFATREFMAYTTINALGCLNEKSLECDDLLDLKYVVQDANAVELGIVLLEDNCFYPRRSITESEVNNVLYVLETINNSVNVAESNIIEYKDGVNIVTEEDILSEDENSLVIKTEATNNVSIGSIIVVNDTKAYKIVSYQNQENGTTVINYVEPELNEFLDYINLAGDLIPDFSRFIPAEGVDVNVSYNDESEIALMGLLDFEDTTIDTGATVHLDGTVPQGLLGSAGDKIDIEYSADISVPTVSYASDIDFHGIIPYVNNAYFKVKQNTDVKASVSSKDPGEDHPIINDMVDTYIPLGTVPLIGSKCVGAVLEVDLKFSISGKVTIEYSVSGDLGCQIYKNIPRNLSSVKPKASVGIEAEAKIGPQLEGALELFNKKLISFSADGGAKVTGEAKYRDNGLVCIDASIGVYVEADVLKDTVINDWLDISLHWDIYDKKTLEGHWENMTKVDECTYEDETAGKAIIKGAVAEATNRNKTISGAKIEVLDELSLEVQHTVYTDNLGNYSISVSPGTHLLRISADGYISFESFETVAQNESIYVETYLMVIGSNNPDAKGTVSGTISNSVNGLGISDVTLIIRKGWNNISGDEIAQIKTDRDGKYDIELPLGNYTILCEKNGYVTNHFNIAVADGTSNNANAVMTPNDGTENIPAGQIRIVLTWGELPYDLDSHLIYQDGQEKQYHIYFNDRTAYDYNSGEILSDLDIDDIWSYGPETVTIYKMETSGLYSYYVRDYSYGYNINDPYLATSGAKVQVFTDDVLIASYNVPSDATGNVWHVFDIDANTNKIIPINEMYGSYSDSLTPSENDIQITEENMPIIQKKTEEESQVIQEEK